MSLVGTLLSSLHDHPVNIVLVGVIGYQLSSLLRSGSSAKQQDSIPTSHNESYNWKPAKHPPCTVWKKYTPKTLEPFHGRDGAQILLAIDGKVFDVTSGRNFYGPDGMYGNFAGRDASRGMAKQSFDEDMLTPVDQPLDKLEDLTREEIANMQGNSKPASDLTPIPHLDLVLQAGLNILLENTLSLVNSLRMEKPERQYSLVTGTLVLVFYPHICFALSLSNPELRLFNLHRALWS
ncbi:cytochrome b5 [Ceratobasidium sp. AG-Ba]|nr:cytochrome b5 [Ceratobasidium sp. AG-Ba]QRW08344.1 cytochrome b5 [Ceratobasidium sp. AG-Ba]